MGGNGGKWGEMGGKWGEMGGKWKNRGIEGRDEETSVQPVPASGHSVGRDPG